MSDKISPSAVAREALALSWRRKGTFAGLVLAGFALALAGTAVPALARPTPGVLIIPGILVYVLGMLFLATTANHLAVTLRRGRGVVLPRPFWPAMGRVLVRGLILAVIGFGILLAVIFPLAAAYPHLPQGPADVSPGVLALAAVAVLAGEALFFCFMLRLAVMIPGAAVGVVVGVREALAMTRGHAWRMFWSMMLIFLPVFLLSVILQMVIASTVFKPGAAVIILSGLLLLAINLFAWIVMLVMNAVWYERLRPRTAGPAGSGPASGFAPGSAPGSGPDPRAGSGVGPYADLPKE